MSRLIYIMQRRATFPVAKAMDTKSQNLMDDYVYLLVFIVLQQERRLRKLKKFLSSCLFNTGNLNKIKETEYSKAGQDIYSMLDKSFIEQEFLEGFYICDGNMYCSYKGHIYERNSIPEIINDLQNQYDYYSNALVSISKGDYKIQDITDSTIVEFENDAKEIFNIIKLYKHLSKEFSIIARQLHITLKNIKYKQLKLNAFLTNLLNYEHISIDDVLKSVNKTNLQNTDNARNNLTFEKAYDILLSYYNLQR